MSFSFRYRTVIPFLGTSIMVWQWSASLAWYSKKLPTSSWLLAGREAFTNLHLYVGQSIAPLYEFNRYCLSVGSTKCGPYGPPPHQQDPTGANTLCIVEWISNKLLSNFVRYPMLHILLFINTIFTAVDPAPSSEEILEQLILPFLSTAHCALSKMPNVHLLVIVCEKRITKDERPF